MFLIKVVTINFTVPAEALAFPSGEMNVTLGAIFQITCEVKGVPFPYITWLHNNRPVTNTYPDDERRLLVEVKHYDMAGPIKCVAKNGVGEEPAVDGVTLIVHCKYILKNFIIIISSIKLPSQLFLI